MEEHVNHPQHYNSHPSGVECIDIIRHYVCDISNVFKYLWRAGLKGEEGMTDREKEIEDMQKALWYLNDYHQSLVGSSLMTLGMFDHPSGIEVDKIASHYVEPVANTFRLLWRVGLITKDGHVLHVPGEVAAVTVAMSLLYEYIETLKKELQ